MNYVIKDVYKIKDENERKKHIIEIIKKQISKKNNFKAGKC